MKKPSEIQGLLMKETKIFYYLETGNVRVSDPLERIQKALLARDILTYNGSKEEISEEKMKKMTLADAQEAGYAVERLYLNAHIKNITKEVLEEKKTISWGKRT